MLETPTTLRVRHNYSIIVPKDPTRSTSTQTKQDLRNRNIGEDMRTPATSKQQHLQQIRTILEKHQQQTEMIQNLLNFLAPYSYSEIEGITNFFKNKFKTNNPLAKAALESRLEKFRNTQALNRIKEAIKEKTTTLHAFITDNGSIDSFLKDLKVEQLKKKLQKKNLQPKDNLTPQQLKQILKSMESNKERSLKLNKQDIVGLITDCNSNRVKYATLIRLHINGTSISKLLNENSDIIPYILSALTAAPMGENNRKSLLQDLINNSQNPYVTLQASLTYASLARQKHQK